MLTKTKLKRCALLLSFTCTIFLANAQILTVDQVIGNAQTQANAVDALVNDITNDPLGNCNFPAVQAGLWGSSYGVVCGASANQEGTLPFPHETHCHTGARAFLTGDNSQRIKIKWKNTVANYARTDDYWAQGEADLMFNVDIGIDQAPVGTNVVVYYHYSAFVGASTDHETDGFLILEEDPIDVQTTLNLGGLDLLPPIFDFTNPAPGGGGVSGWNSVKDVYGSLTVQVGQTFALNIASSIEAEIVPLAKPYIGPFDVDQSDGIFHGEIVFSVTPFIDIPVQTSDSELLFSLDIGSDSELGDPQLDGDEQFDPGDVYEHNSISSALATYLDDQTIFGLDPIPNAPGPQIPYHNTPMDLLGQDIFDLDGFEVSEWNLDFWVDQMPISIEPGDCTPLPDNFLLSFDDDTRENWSDILPSLPVESLSPTGLTFGETMNRDEVVTAYSISGGASPHVQYPLANEGLLHQALLPNPLLDFEDDDCDALAIDRSVNGTSLCPFAYFSVDREGRHFDPVTGTVLNPGSIYQVMWPGTISEVLTPAIIGIPDGTDIDAFTFGGLPGDDFTAVTFALYFSVDEDDPQTPEDESGGLDPRIIYYSILNGSAWELSTVPFQDDIDAMTLADPVLGMPGTPCITLYYEDADGDGFGTSGASITSCVPVPGYATNDTDCDDLDPDVYPGAPGTGDGKDNDCDGVMQGDEVTCPGDFNGDSFRNTPDLLAFMAVFGCTTNCGIYDLDGDGLVNSADMLIFLGYFGMNCP